MIRLAMFLIGLYIRVLIGVTVFIWGSLIIMYFLGII